MRASIAALDVVASGLETIPTHACVAGVSTAPFPISCYATTPCFNSPWRIGMGPPASAAERCSSVNPSISPD